MCRNFSKWAGSALSIIAIIFVVGKLNDYSNEIDYFLFVSLAPPLIVLSIAYGAANLLLTFTWVNLLRHFGVSIVAYQAIRIYGISQLAKYVPGNIFHFVGRQALGLDVGLPAWSLAKSAIWEIGALTIAGTLFTILVGQYFLPEFPVSLTVGLFLLAVLLTVWISNRWISRAVAQAVSLDVVFLILSATIFAMVLSLVDSAKTITPAWLVIVCGAYVIAWLAGLVTPGAPAGVGIREIVLYAILHPYINEAGLLTAIIFGRVVTIVGDILFFLLALLIRPPLIKTV